MIDRPGGTGISSAHLAPALERMVDALAWPLLLIDRHGAVHHANRAAHQLLAAKEPLLLGKDRRLRPAARQQRAAFVAALAAAAQGEHCLLRWPGPAGVINARLQPLPPAQDSPALLLLALPAAAAAAAQVEQYAQGHGLTAAEARVLQGLAQGHSAPRVAAALGLASSTVRSHIVALRRKTGHASVHALRHGLAQLPPALGLPHEGK